MGQGASKAAGAGKSCAIIVTGLPASGKTTQARALATALGWPMLDKDDCLERLYDTVAVTSMDIRRQLSRKADVAFKREAIALPQVVLVSHWRPRGVHSTSGTPTDWVLAHFTTTLELHCACAWQTALARFQNRSRHPGHLDDQRPEAALATQLKALEPAYPLGLSPHISVSTEARVDAGPVLAQIRELLVG
ncbi:MAG: AAA family ATPase [Pseudorhodobacter sp.]